MVELPKRTEHRLGVHDHRKRSSSGFFFFQHIPEAFSDPEYSSLIRFRLSIFSVFSKASIMSLALKSSSFDLSSARVMTSRYWDQVGLRYCKRLTSRSLILTSGLPGISRQIIS